jgi:hypothetical protein
MKPGDPEPAGAGTVKQVITLQQGIPSDAAREIVKYLKDHKLKKVQASIQGDQLRIASASKDDLQGPWPRCAGFRGGAAVWQLPLTFPGAALSNSDSRAAARLAPSSSPAASGRRRTIATPRRVTPERVPSR